MYLTYLCKSLYELEERLIDLKRISSRSIVIIIFIIATVIFVWSNSLQSIDQSGARSTQVMEFIKPVLEVFIGRGNVTDHLVRKLAHFVEFGLIGLELALLFRRFTITPFFLSILIALTDETIQLFTGRSSQVQDVWLDFAGACFGFLFCLALLWLRKKLKLHKTVKI